MYETWWMFNYRWHRWRQRRAMFAFVIHENSIRLMQEEPLVHRVNVRMIDAENQTSTPTENSSP